jgi:hypothetical protein
MLNDSLIRFRLLLGLLTAFSAFVLKTRTWADDVQGSDNWVTKEGRYVRLVTDLPDSESLVHWVAAFDAAVPLWAEYWGRNLDALRGWRITAYIMADKSKFVAAGVVPRTLPDFRFGYQVGTRIWVLHQPEDYYSRHLLLHEGAHAITDHLFGGGGPPWFMEGTAEWMSTHSWQLPTSPLESPKITIGVVPQSSTEAQGWGRIELIENARRQKQVPSLESVMKYNDAAHREVEPYAWSWLAATLLEMYPDYRQVRREAAIHAADRSPQFNSNLYAKLRNQWPIVSARWNLLANDIDYGWDPSYQLVDLSMSLPPLSRKVEMKLDSRHGWQSAPIKLSAGQSVNITSSGKYKIRESTRDWYSEPDGITIHYYKGHPIGKLVARLLPMAATGGGPYAAPPQDVAIGAAGIVTASQDSWLLLKINEAPGEYADNEGELAIELQPDR